MEQNRTFCQEAVAVKGQGSKSLGYEEGIWGVALLRVAISLGGGVEI